LVLPNSNTAVWGLKNAAQQLCVMILVCDLFVIIYYYHCRVLGLNREPLTTSVSIAPYCQEGNMSKVFNH